MGTGEASRRHISIQWYTRLLAQGRHERGPIGTLQGFRSRLVAAWSVAACFLVQLRAAPHPHWYWWLQVSTKRLILSRCERSVLQKLHLRTSVLCPQFHAPAEIPEAFGHGCSLLSVFSGDASAVRTSLQWKCK